MDEMADCVKKGKDMAISIYDMMRCRQPCAEEIPELVTGLQEVMKKYVVLETSWIDLNTTKNKVSRHFIDCPDPEEVNIDVIHQEIKKVYEQETSKHQENYWEQDPNFATLVDFSKDIEEPVEDENDGEDIAVTSMAVQTIDPYTKKEFVDPVKNIKCNHSYERATITELLKAQKPPRCYHMGCNNKQVLAKDLRADEDLRRHMARLRAQQGI